MSSTSSLPPIRPTRDKAVRTANFVLFFISYVVFLYSISNKLGTRVPQGIDSTGKYIPHEYYTGYMTGMPFKIILGIITLGLLVSIIMTRVGTKKTLLLLPIAVSILGFIGVMLTFFLFWEF